MLASNFGKLLEGLVSDIKENPGKLDSGEFREMLAQAAREWADIALEFNGGNDRSYNLCRMGSYIESIQQACEGPIPTFPHERPPNWGRILDDVRYVSKIVRHELLFNIVKVSPHPYHNETTAKYRRMQDSDFD